MKANTPFLYTTILIFGSLISGCTKSKEKTFTITGHILKGCDKVPVANKAFILFQSFGDGGTVGNTTTDANGYFSAQYVPKNNGPVKIAIQLTVGVDLYGELTPYKNYTDAVIYREPTCYLKVRMQVYNNGYTNKDTLYIVDYRRNLPPYTLAVPGPFTSQEIYNVPNYGILNYTEKGAEANYGYQINKGAYINKTAILKACDTVTFIADIR